MGSRQSRALGQARAMGLRTRGLGPGHSPRREGVRLCPRLSLLSEAPAGVSPDHHCPSASFQAGLGAQLLAIVSTLTLTLTPTWPTALETNISWRLLGAGDALHTHSRNYARGPPSLLPRGGLSSLHCPDHWCPGTFTVPAFYRPFSEAEARSSAPSELPCSPSAPCPALTPTLVSPP